jgi:hypothetical protein
MDFLKLCKDTWKDCGLSGPGPQDVTKSESMHGRVVSWVQDAYIEVQQRHYNWAFLYKVQAANVAANKNGYTAKQLGIADFSQLVSVSRQDSPTKWTPMTMSPVYDPFTYGKVLGQPGEFVITPDLLWYFNKMPDANYAMGVQYYRTPHELLTNLDEPIIPDEYQRIIRHRAKQLYGIYDEEEAAVQDATSSFNSLIVRMEARFLPPLRWAENEFTGG